MKQGVVGGTKPTPRWPSGGYSKLSPLPLSARSALRCAGAEAGELRQLCALPPAGTSGRSIPPTEGRRKRLFSGGKV